MELILTDTLKSALRSASNHRHHKNYLLKLDNSRFRGLGEGHSKEFIFHAMRYCERLGFSFVEEVQYVMFLMYFLGSHFYDDPRYVELSEALTTDVKGEDTRVSRCYEIFAPFAEKYIGDEFAIYRKALARYAENADMALTQDNPIRACFEAFFIAYEFDTDARRDFPVQAIFRQAEEASKALGIHSNRGVAICVSMALWMGTGFYNDTLFPWVQDKVDEAGDDKRAREDSLLAYAQKRMKHQIKEFEDPENVS